jgi:hypothetical protein
MTQATGEIKWQKRRSYNCKKFYSSGPRAEMKSKQIGRTSCLFNNFNFVDEIRAMPDVTKLGIL